MSSFDAFFLFVRIPIANSRKTHDLLSILSAEPGEGGVGKPLNGAELPKYIISGKIGLIEALQLWEFALT